MYVSSRSGSSIRLFVFSDSAVFDKVSITEDMLNRRILSHSVTAWNNYIPAFLTFIYGKAKRRHMWKFFCLLPFGVCIDAYVMICSYVLCVSTP